MKKHHGSVMVEKIVVVGGDPPMIKNQLSRRRTHGEKQSPMSGLSQGGARLEINPDFTPLSEISSEKSTRMRVYF
jgi:hypothetical protein